MSRKPQCGNGYPLGLRSLTSGFNSRLGHFMKWKSHIAIAKAISRYLGLPKNLEKALVDGSIEPDKYPDKVLRVGRRGSVYTARMPHHDPDLGVIMKHIWNSRQVYLNGDDFQAMKNLGRALHYVQDKSVARGFLGLAHDSREYDLSYTAVPEDAIKTGIDTALSSPHHVKKIVNSVKPKNNLDEIIEQACLSSASIAKAVISEKEPPSELVEHFKSAKENHYKKALPLSIGIAAVILIVSIITKNLLIAICGILAGYLTQRFDPKYYFFKEEAKWFGIK